MTVISGLVHALRDGFEHTIIYSHRPETPKNVEETFGDSATLIHLEMNFLKEFQLLFSASSYLNSFLNERRPRTIVHCHSSIAGVLGRLISRRGGIPSLYTPHAYAFLNNANSKFVNSAYYAAEWLLARIGSGTVACGEDEYAIAKKLSGNRPVFLARNGIDINTIESILKYSPPKKNIKPLVAVIGRVSPQFDVSMFNDIVQHLRDVYDFVWIGAAHDETQVFESVRKTGWMPHRDALMELAKADIVLHLTRYDGLSCSLLEAMAMNKVVIATDKPSNVSVIKDGVTGFIFSDSESIVKKLLFLLNNDAALRPIGLAAGQYVRDVSNVTAMAEIYAKIYQSVCTHGHAS